MRIPFVFFFQAEDGIRALYVTGVQTCALPIWSGWNFSRSTRASPAGVIRWIECAAARSVAGPADEIDGNCEVGARSEERRVGKECSCRGLCSHDNKKL